MTPNQIHAAVRLNARLYGLDSAATAYRELMPEGGWIAQDDARKAVQNICATAWIDREGHYWVADPDGQVRCYGADGPGMDLADATRLYGLTPVDPSEVRTNVYPGCTCGCND